MRTLPTTLVLAALMLLGCPRDQDAPPGDPTSAGNSVGSETSAVDSSATAPTSADSTAGSESGTTGGCVGPDGCYDCAPQSSEQVLNRCTDAACEPFANTADRLPRLGADGALPPIP
jgi:hypothetical protein